MKTLKDIVRAKMADGIADFRRAYSDIVKDWPRNRKEPSFETVRRYFRQRQEQVLPSPESQEVATDDKETILVGCHLRNVLTLAAQESLTITTVVQMGLIPVLDQLAKRGRELNDPELNTVLDSLSLGQAP